MRERIDTRVNSVQAVFTVLLMVLLMGCASTTPFAPGKGSKYQYTYRMVYPVENAELLYQDDSIVVQFKFDDAALKFQLQNVSDVDVHVHWSRAAISINGRYYPVRHADNLYSDSTGSQASMILPPLGFIRDLAIPRQNEYFDGNQWVEEDLLPTTDNGSPELRDKILSGVGQSVTLLLPLQFENGNRNYEFEFQVSAVDRIAWKDFQPVKRVPPPPEPQHGRMAITQLTTAVIAVGILGFSAYLLTRKKSPAPE